MEQHLRVIELSFRDGAVECFAQKDGRTESKENRKIGEQKDWRKIGMG